MNIVLIVGDTVRADHLGCYGYFRDTTPTIDALAREGVLFPNYHSAACPTGPGFTTIYTGLHPINHRYYLFGAPNTRQVDDTIFTMPELFRAAGYTTVGFDNLMNCLHARSKHFVRGYDWYVNCGPEPFNTAHYLTADRLNARLLPFIPQLPEPFFLFIHYWDPHMPYNQPEEFRTFHHEEGKLDDLIVKRAPAGYDYVPGWGKVGQMADGILPATYGPYPTMSIDLYDGELRFMDHAIGEVIAALEAAGVYDRTATIFTADHGEHLNQHAGYGWEHRGLHDADTHLPLVIRYPERLAGGSRAPGFCQQIDLLPTLLDLAGLSRELVPTDGTSALPLSGGRGGRRPARQSAAAPQSAAGLREHLFMEDMFGQRAVRTGRWKLLDSRIQRNRTLADAREDAARRAAAGNPGRPLDPEVELFDLAADPMEVIDVATANPDVVRDLRGKLDRWVASQLDGRGDPALYDDLDLMDSAVKTYREKVKALMADFS